MPMQARRWRQMCGPNTFATSALELCGCSAPCYGRFTSGKKPVPFVQEAESAWEPVRMIKRIRRHRDSIPKPAIRILSQHRLRHPGTSKKIHCLNRYPPPFLRNSAQNLCTFAVHCLKTMLRLELNLFVEEQQLKKTRIKLYNTLAFPVLLYGSETWTIIASDARRITAAEMKYMRRTAG